MKFKVTAQDVDDAITNTLFSIAFDKDTYISVLKTLAWSDTVKARIYAHATAEKIAHIINDADEEKQP